MKLTNLPTEFDIKQGDDFENPVLVLALYFLWIMLSGVVYMVFREVGFSDFFSVGAGFLWLMCGEIIPNYFHAQRMTKVYKEEKGEYSQRELVTRIAEKLEKENSDKLRKIWEEYFLNSEIHPIFGELDEERVWEMVVKKMPHVEEIHRWADDGGAVPEPEKDPLNKLLKEKDPLPPL